jgi:hypothetical protein
MTHPLECSEPYKLLELVDCGPVDLEALKIISASLTYEAPTMTAQFNKEREVVLATDNADIGALSSLAGSVQAYQHSRNGPLEVVTINAARIEFNRSHFYPWHSDNIPDAFSVSLEASTEGLRGEIDASNQAAALSKITIEAEKDDELSHMPSLRIVRFPLGHLVRITRGAIHRSPACSNDTEEPRLLVVANVFPKFW